MIYDHKLPTCVLLQCVDRWSISSNIKCSIVKNPTMLGNCNESRLLKPWCLKKTHIYIYIYLISIYLFIYLSIWLVVYQPLWTIRVRPVGMIFHSQLNWFQSAPSSWLVVSHCQKSRRLTRLLEETFQAGLTWSIKMPPSPTCNLGEPKDLT